MSERIISDELIRDLQGNAYAAGAYQKASYTVKTLDTEEIIRCRDCKYCSNESVYTPQFYCVSPHWNNPAYAVETDSNGFCSWAERREA